MSVKVITAAQALAELGSFDAVIDARSESEFASDHLPRAVNYPTLTDAERHEVGTIYKQVSAFDARKLGGAYAARNIANTLLTHLQDKPKDWKPLIYCWRGGKRSGSLALVLDQVGFDVHLIEGGYKAFRAQVLDDYARLASQFDYRVICAPTGSGKTRLLQALAKAVAQVLDLEDLANHRSSVLGFVPGTQQPSQKQFDMRVWQTLKALDSARPVFVESESKKVGNVSVSDALMHAIRQGVCIRLDLPMDSRVSLLLEDYDFFVQDPVYFGQRLEVLIPLRVHEVVNRWKDYIAGGQWREVVTELLGLHYDPTYLSSMQRNFVHYATANVQTLIDHGHATFDGLAQQLHASSNSQL